MLTLLFALAVTILDPVRPLAKHPIAVKGLAVSPDRTQLASISRDGLIIIWDLKTQKEVKRIASSNLAVCLAWPQADRLIAVGALTLDVVHPGKGQVLERYPVGQRSDCGAISRDGRFAAVANTHFIGKLLNAATGKEIKPFPAPSEWSYSMDFSADSKLLAIGGNNPDSDGIALLETQGFTMLREWPTKVHHGIALRFSPDGKLLAVAGAKSTLKIWNVDGSLLNSIPLAHTHAPTLSFSPDGKHLLVCSGVPLHQFLPHHFDYPLPDESKRITTTPTLQCFSVGTQKEIWRSDVLQSWACVICFVSETRFVTGHYDGTLRFWDLPVER